MDSRPPSLLLLLTSLLHISQCAREQPSYIVDTVELKILPSSTVQSGTLVTLLCQVRVSHDNIPNLTHTFQLTRDDVLIHFNTTTEDSFIYELNPARAADSGSYECRVTVKDKSKTSYSQKLDVTGLQTPILHLNKTMPFQSEEFTATCSAPDEKGSLIFRFYQRFRMGEPLKIKQSAPTRNSSETTLVLREVGDRILYCDYEINLDSGPRRSSHSNEIQVVVKALYIKPIMNVQPSSDVFEGDILEVTCKVVQSPHKDVEVFLIKDRRILKKAPISLNHRFTALKGDSRELVCKAEWGNVQQETNRTITVKELFSKPRLTVDPIDIFEGDHFKLDCSVSTYATERVNRENMQFDIYKDNIKVETSYTYVTVANPDTNGNYTCKVRATAVDKFVKESQKLAVNFKVPVSIPTLSVVGGKLVLGKPFQLLCHSDSGTLPISYTLYGPAMLNETRVVSKPGEQAVFNSPAVFKISDLNNFLCHAKNGQNKPAMVRTGQQLQNSANIIEPVSRPQLTIQPSMSGVSEGQTMVLVCSVQKGTLPITFTWYHTAKKGAIYLLKSHKLKESYNITNVVGEHGGQYFCVCTNPANETKQSYSVDIVVTLAPWKKGLIAVFCIIVILGLMLLCALRRRLRQFKRKRTTELTMKSTSTKLERLSLTEAEVMEAANATPGMIGKSIWSEHVSGSDSDDQNSETAAEPQYTEVQTRQADPNRAPVKMDTDTVYNEVRNSKQGVPELGDGQRSMEYAQLNHETDHHGDDGDYGDDGDHGGHGDDGNHDGHSVQDDHTVQTDNSVDISISSCGE